MIDKGKNSLRKSLLLRRSIGDMVSAKDTDLYRFRVARSSDVTLSLSRLQRNADISVYAPRRPLRRVFRALQGSFDTLSRRRIHRNLKHVGFSRRKGRRNEQVLFEADPGTYFVRVSSRLRKGTRYRLMLDKVATEAVTAVEDVRVLDLFSSHVGQLSGEGAQDRFQLTLPERMRVGLALVEGSSGSRFRLLDGKRTEVARSGPSGVVESSISRLLRAGTYVVEVSNASAMETRYTLNAQATVPKTLSLYSGEGLLSQSGMLAPAQLPLPEAQVAAIATSFGVPFSSIPSEFIAPRDARETSDSASTTLNTELFDGLSAGLVGYMSHVIDPNSVEVLSVLPVPLLDAELMPIQPLPLHAELGYAIDFTVAVESVVTDSPDASGFNLLVMGSGGTGGVELGWTSTGILARDARFNAAERVTFDAILPTQYSLSVLGDRYTLLANGQPLLNGPLRNYQFNPIAAAPALPYNPYRTPNYLFIGDNSDSGRSIFSIEALAVVS